MRVLFLKKIRGQFFFRKNDHTGGGLAKDHTFSDFFFEPFPYENILYGSWIVRVEIFVLLPSLTLVSMYFWCKTVLLWDLLKVSEKYFPQCEAENQIKGVDIAGDFCKIWKIENLRKTLKQHVGEFI